MNIWNIHKTYGNIRRLRQIVTVLAKCGFSHFIQQIRLLEYAPWLERFLEKPTRPGEHIDRSLAERLADAFQELGPAFIKLGQLLAIRPDIVTPEFQEAFSRLQDRVEPMPPEKVAPIIEAELGKPVTGVFREFDPKAIASGSIGQANLATLADGTAVVVKVRRPDIGPVIQNDLALLRLLADLMERHVEELKALRPTLLVEELARAMMNELDFAVEAAAATKFRNLHRDMANLKCPRVYWEYVTPGVLVMERLDGTPLTGMAALPGEERRRLAAEIGEAFMRQYFFTGYFHADPHPGNLFRCGDGRLGLIDFGQIGHISEDMRRTLALAIMALGAGEVEFVADLYSEIGDFDGTANIRGFRADLRDFVDRNYSMPADRLDFARIGGEALSVARRNGLRLPRDFVLLAKSFVTVAGVVRELDPTYRLDLALAPFTKSLGLNLVNPKGIARRLGVAAYRFLGMFRRLPDDARDLMEKARAGKFTIVFHHENLQDAAERTGRAVDRLTLGMIASAMIIGGSIVLVAGRELMPGSSLPLVGTAPISAVIAAAAFIGAFLTAGYVAWGIFRDKY